MAEFPGKNRKEPHVSEAEGNIANKKRQSFFRLEFTGILHLGFVGFFVCFFICCIQEV